MLLKPDKQTLAKKRYMLYDKLKIWILLLSAILLTGCVQEDFVFTGTIDDMRFAYTAVSVKLPTTRGMSTGDEKAISDITMLAFKVNGTDNPATNTFAYAVTASTIGASSFQVPVRTSSGDTHKLVFIANASSSISNVVNAFSAVTTESEATELLIYSMNIPFDITKSIPMWGQTKPSVITEGMDISDLYLKKTDGVCFLRTLSRINIHVNAGDFRINSVAVYKANTEAALVPFSSNLNTDKTGVTTPSIPATSSLSNTPWNYVLTADEKNNNAVVNRIYIPESKAISSPADTELPGSTCVVVGGFYAGGTTETFYRIDFLSSSNVRMDMLRNYSYNINIQNIANEGYASADMAFNRRPVNIETMITAFDDRLHITTDGAYQLSCSASPMVCVEYNQSARNYTVITDYPDGWDAEVIDKTATWLTVTPNNNGAGRIGTLQINTTEFVVTGSQIYREATVLVSAGRIKREIIVRQYLSPISFPDIYPTGTISYVGAFWRSHQKAERLIRIPITADDEKGPWSAAVIYRDENWDDSYNQIILDNSISRDPNIYTTSAARMLQDGVGYGVSGLTPYVSGDTFDPSSPYPGEIYFRIGLKDYFSASSSKPARYAVVLVTYGVNKSFRIFLRQGEAADYLMRVQDPDIGGQVPLRAFAKRIQPFNLTSPDAQNNNETDIQNIPELGAGDAVYTDYPTQAGSFFFFNFSRQAINPHIWLFRHDNWRNNVSNGNRYFVFDEPAISPYGFGKFGHGVYYYLGLDGNTYTNNGTQVTLPNDDSAQQDNDTNDSEMKQSYFANLSDATDQSSTENARYGYYADGLFDRLPFEKQPTFGYGATDTGNAKLANTYEVCYGGALFFNPYNFASVFLPMAGYRGHAVWGGWDVVQGDAPDPSTGYPKIDAHYNGSLRHAGRRGVYLSASSPSYQQMWSLILSCDTGRPDDLISVISANLVSRTGAGSYRTATVD